MGLAGAGVLVIAGLTTALAVTLPRHNSQRDVSLNPSDYGESSFVNVPVSARAYLFLFSGSIYRDCEWWTCLCWCYHALWIGESCRRL